MKCLIITLVFLKLNLINSLAINQRSLEDAERALSISNEDYKDEESDYISDKSSKGLCTQDRAGNKGCFKSVTQDEQPVPAPPNPYKSGLYQYYRQPSVKWNKPWGAVAYEIDNSANYMSNAAFSTYNNGQNSYGHPSAWNLLPPVSNLPPVISTHVHESLPIQKKQNFLSRPIRVVRSQDEEDFLAELSHRSIMNNILPTMPVPFTRSSYGYGVPQGLTQTAVFPYASPGCALPILISCSPRINKGVLGHRVYRKYPNVMPPPKRVYQKDVEAKDANDTNVVKHDKIKPRVLKSDSAKNSTEHATQKEPKESSELGFIKKMAVDKLLKKKI